MVRAGPAGATARTSTLRGPVRGTSVRAVAATREPESAYMSPSEAPQAVRSELPAAGISLIRAAAVWKRPAGAGTTLPVSELEVHDWRPEQPTLAAYRALVGSLAEMPLAFAQVPIMAMHLDLLSRWSFPIRAIGVVHLGSTIEVLDELPGEEPWDLRAWVSGSRHVRSGLEFDLHGEVSCAGRVRWRSTAVNLSRSRAAAGAEGSTVPGLDTAGTWQAEQPMPVGEGTGRAFGRLTGDVNPIHLHALPARAFGFRRAIAHGWWTTGRSAALLGVDESVPGRRLEIAFHRPVELPSTPVLCSRRESTDGLEFALFPDAPDRSAAQPARALVAGRVTG